MIVCFEAGFFDRVKELEEGLIRCDLDPDRQKIDETTDERFDVSTTTVGNWVPNDKVRLAGNAIEKGGESGLKSHEERGASFSAELLQCHACFLRTFESDF